MLYKPLANDHSLQLWVYRPSFRWASRKHAHHTLKSLVCSCVSITLPASSLTRITASAHRDSGKRFVVRGDEKLTAFAELESAIGRIGGSLHRLVRPVQSLYSQG
jgi:hypothetical protein